MYGKIFKQMYEGSMAKTGDWQAIVTFQQLIVLSDADGVVDMTPEAISRLTTIPLDILAAGIKSLEEPDPNSRTPDEEGKRIVRLREHSDWGWRIVNYGKYRAIRSEEERREYQRQYWHKRKHKNSNGSTALNNPQRNSTHAEAEVKAEEEESRRPIGRLNPKSEIGQKIAAVAAQHDVTPR